MQRDPGPGTARAEVAVEPGQHMQQGQLVGISEGGIQQQQQQQQDQRNLDLGGRSLPVLGDIAVPSSQRRRFEEDEALVDASHKLGCISIKITLEAFGIYPNSYA